MGFFSDNWPLLLGAGLLLTIASFLICIIVITVVYAIFFTGEDEPELNIPPVKEDEEEDEKKDEDEYDIDILPIEIDRSTMVLDDKGYNYVYGLNYVSDVTGEHKEGLPSFITYYGKVDDYKECEDLCAGDKDCKHWVYYNRGYKESKYNDRCYGSYRTSGKSNSIVEDNLYSGTKVL